MPAYSATRTFMPLALIAAVAMTCLQGAAFAGTVPMEASHRTVQVKATAAVQRAVLPADEPALQSYLSAMQHAVAQVGYGPQYTAAMLNAPRDDLVAVEFSPEAAFDQTPGPHAGEPLRKERQP